MSIQLLNAELEANVVELFLDLLALRFEALTSQLELLSFLFRFVGIQRSPILFQLVQQLFTLRLQRCQYCVQIAHIVYDRIRQANDI